MRGWTQDQNNSHIDRGAFVFSKLWPDSSTRLSPFPSFVVEDHGKR